MPSQTPSNAHLTIPDGKWRGGREFNKLFLSTSDEIADPENIGNDSLKGKHILIIGGGVSGLLVAWMLLDRGYQVTILAKDWAWTKDFQGSRITSQIAGALWEMPPGGCGLTEIANAKPGYANLEDYQQWAIQSYKFYCDYAKLASPHEKGGWSLGLKIADLHQFFYDDIFNGTGRNTEHYKKYNIMDTHTMDFGTAAYNNNQAITAGFQGNTIFDTRYRGEFKSAYTHKAPILNTDKALAYLMALVQRKGATLETREIKDLYANGQQLLNDFGAQVIVNATGLGSKDLVGDDDVYPVRGAIRRVENTRRSQFRHLNDAYLVPAQKGPDNKPTKTVFIVPRNDDILYVGSIIQPNNWNLNLTEESPEVQQMWDRAGDFMPRLRHAGFVNHFPFAQGLRPFTKNNAKVRADEKAEFHLVHNYGHGGSGWTLGIGTARCAVDIVEGLLLESKAQDINRGIYQDIAAAADSAGESAEDTLKAAAIAYAASANDS
ncbi:FAD dependent oxidoreductase-domain-containing protein [Aspergillus pseudocaelatus]|uniref:FAD dependent oxidoreductase-domain-containing protein n=1 Tax=Aspergillus pseudocaelatus TaxID=1825620 RepID=A0ABQ6WPK4_9EURO|nr:FAD dependent oxidoreductase-domain-containing protein [Aspergillus pseudocaelatus]